MSGKKTKTKEDKHFKFGINPQVAKGFALEIANIKVRDEINDEELPLVEQLKR